MPTRHEAYQAVNSERDYQDAKYGQSLSSGRPGDGSRTLDEFMLYLYGLAHRGAIRASASDDPVDKLEYVRMIAATAVQCLEQHGAPHRQPKPGEGRT